MLIRIKAGLFGVPSVYYLIGGAIAAVFLRLHQVNQVQVQPHSCFMCARSSPHRNFLCWP